MGNQSRYLANRGHIGIRSTMNNKLLTPLHVPFDINRNGKSQPYHLTLQLLLQILPKVARFILLGQN